MATEGRPIDSDTFSFVVRIWYEGNDSEGQAPRWRGSIEHVGAGQRRHFVDLDEISRYIEEYAGPLDRRDAGTAATSSLHAGEMRSS